MNKVNRMVSVKLSTSGGIKAIDLAEFVASIPPWVNVSLNDGDLLATWSAKAPEITIPKEL